MPSIFSVDLFLLGLIFSAASILSGVSIAAMTDSRGWPRFVPCGRSGLNHQPTGFRAGPFFGTLKNEWFHHERPMDAESTRFLAVESRESYHDRYRPHEAMGDRMPAEVMDEFLARFEA